jgi:hypothetical protein
MTPGKLVHVFRRPRYPVLCAVPGDLIVAYSLQQLERRVSKVEVPPDGVLDIIDATGEGWALHTAMGAVSPMTMKKNWTKTELLNLYRESATGRRVSLPLEDKVLIRRRLDALILFIAELLRTGGPNKPVQPPEQNGKRQPPRCGPRG